jgi:hypothetical protein
MKMDAKVKDMITQFSIAQASNNPKEVRHFKA